MPDTSKDDNAKPSIIALNTKEILESLSLKEAFRAHQIFKWVSKGIDSFSKMTDLPTALIERLEENFSIYTSKVFLKLEESSSIKLGIELKDGNIIEAVLLVDKAKRETACLSSQVGCPLSCSFCKTGSLGFIRNLASYEIIEEFFYLQAIAKKRIENIVFMGMGEPCLNLDALEKAILILTDKGGIGLSKRRITISTAGLISGIYKIASWKAPPRLAVSLTVAEHEKRMQLMPIEKTNPLPKLKEAIRYFNKKTKKRVTLEVALIRGVNTSKNMVKKMIEFAMSLNVLVNLIPWNPVANINLEVPSKKEVENVKKELERGGLLVTVRKKRGTSISGACGQLGKIKKI